MKYCSIEYIKNYNKKVIDFRIFKIYDEFKTHYYFIYAYIKYQYYTGNFAGINFSSIIKADDNTSINVRHYDK